MTDTTPGQPTIGWLNFDIGLISQGRVPALLVGEHEGMPIVDVAQPAGVFRPREARLVGSNLMRFEADPDACLCVDRGQDHVAGCPFAVLVPRPASRASSLPIPTDEPREAPVTRATAEKQASDRVERARREEYRAEHDVLFEDRLAARRRADTHLLFAIEAQLARIADAVERQR